jgi:nicotinic acid mononucleotide adenylyltransferase
VEFQLKGLELIIKNIHASPQRVVFDFAGAGALALAWLHSVGGSSRTILEATDCYAPDSLIDLIGFEPEKFVSLEVARAMAIRAYSRACRLADPDMVVAGVGCTATIATDRAKRGDHEAYVAICDAECLNSYALTLSKGERTRQQEETLVSGLVVQAMADVFGLAQRLPLDLRDTDVLVQDCEAVDWLARVLAGEVNWVAIAPDGRARPGQTRPNTALLSGAFNPLHYGHRQLAKVAADRLGQEVFFELPLINADKGPLHLDDAQRRVAQFTDLASVILTRAPLFNQKAQLFPYSIFIVGVDTVERLWQPRFYHDDSLEMYAAFNTIRQNDCRFLVACRSRNNHILTLSDINIPAVYRDLFQEIPASDFHIDISSTGLRIGHVDG